MGTKNLARTAIEGGRVGRNKWERRYSHAETRAHEKAYLGEVKEDIENWYDYDIEPTRPVRKEFNDKLGPMYRWLERQVGKLWDEVRSDVTTAFDTRTTAGRHIVYDHLLSSVAVTPEIHRRWYQPPDDPTISYSRHDFFVDDAGILCQKRYVSRKGHNKIPPFNTNQIANWLSGRIVGKLGNKLYWFVPADKNKKRGGTARTWRTEWGARKYYYHYGLRFIYLAEKTVYKKDLLTGKIILNEAGNATVAGTEMVWEAGTPNFRQGNKLNPKELAYWNTLPEYYQERILELSPTNPNKPEPNYGRYYY